MRVLAAFILAFVGFMAVASAPARADNGDRALYLFYTHTNETAKIIFKRGGKFDPAGLAQLNYFLRDWRRNEPTKMDPALFDIIWEIYNDVGASGPIHVVSAYRAPATNEMLRARSSAVAKDSRHTHGMAMDFFIPGVPLTKLREAAMRRQVGGVGYYPTSGSPFVHVDTGNVRAWPRMTRTQLAKIFPEGKTLHLPTDGVPLSKTGRQYAQAQWVKCHSVPCSSRNTYGADVRVADGGQKYKGPTLLEMIFGGGDDEEPTDSEAATSVIAVAQNEPAPRAIQPVPEAAPVPFARPEVLDANPLVMQVASLDVPVPLDRPSFLGADTSTVVAEAAPIPAIRNLSLKQADPVLTAYAPSASSPSSDAVRALEILISRRNAEADLALNTAPSGPEINQVQLTRDQMVTASLAPTLGIAGLKGIFDRIQKPASANAAKNIAVVLPAAVQMAPQPMPVDIADLAPFPGADALEIFDHDQADFAARTELGQAGLRIGFGEDPGKGLQMLHFSRNTLTLASAR